MQATWPKRWPRRDRASLAAAFQCNSQVNEAAQASCHGAANLIGFSSTAPTLKKKPYGFALLAAAASFAACNQPSFCSSSGLVDGCGPTRRIRNASCVVRGFAFDFGLKKAGNSSRFSTAIQSALEARAIDVARLDFSQCS